MTTLTDFLLARIAEDEARVESDQDHFGMTNDPRDKWIVKYSERMAAECAAKRRIVAMLGDVGRYEYDAIDDVVCLLATVYAGHPDYDEEWRP